MVATNVLAPVQRRIVDPGIASTESDLVRFGKRDWFIRGGFHPQIIATYAVDVRNLLWRCLRRGLIDPNVHTFRDFIKRFAMPHFSARPQVLRQVCVEIEVCDVPSGVCHNPRAFVLDPLDADAYSALCRELGTDKIVSVDGAYELHNLSRKRIAQLGRYFTCVSEKGAPHLASLDYVVPAQFARDKLSIARLWLHGIRVAIAECIVDVLLKVLSTKNARRDFARLINQDMASSLAHYAIRTVINDRSVYPYMGVVVHGDESSTAATDGKLASRLDRPSVFRRFATDVLQIEDLPRSAERNLIRNLHARIAAPLKNALLRTREHYEKFRASVYAAQEREETWGPHSQGGDGKVPKRRAHRTRFKPRPLTDDQRRMYFSSLLGWYVTHQTHDIDVGRLVTLVRGADALEPDEGGDMSVRFDDGAADPVYISRSVRRGGGGRRRGRGPGGSGGRRSRSRRPPRPARPPAVVRRPRVRRRGRRRHRPVPLPRPRYVAPPRYTYLRPPHYAVRRTGGVWDFLGTLVHSAAMLRAMDRWQQPNVVYIASSIRDSNVTDGEFVGHGIGKDRRRQQAGGTRTHRNAVHVDDIYRNVVVHPSYHYLVEAMEFYSQYYARARKGGDDSGGDVKVTEADHEDTPPLYPDTMDPDSTVTDVYHTHLLMTTNVSGRDLGTRLMREIERSEPLRRFYNRMKSFYKKNREATDRRVRRSDRERVVIFVPNAKNRKAPAFDKTTHVFIIKPSPSAEEDDDEEGVSGGGGGDRATDVDGDDADTNTLIVNEDGRPHIVLLGRAQKDDAEDGTEDRDDAADVRSKFSREAALQIDIMSGHAVHHVRGKKSREFTVSEYVDVEMPKVNFIFEE